MNCKERFLNYIAIDTASDENSQTVPSSSKQLQLLKLLQKEMQELGLAEITLDDNGYLFASLAANTDVKVPVVGFLAHVDTIPDFPGKCVNPKVFTYEGGDIKLNDDAVMTPEVFPVLNEIKGEEVITTDGTTLLGADDKAGIANIMSAVAYLREHPEIKHGKIRIGFTPDEEIGRGPWHFDVNMFGADFAYTIDGGYIGELESETFNAASANITIHGENIHPGTAKKKMVNSLLLGMELQRLLPEFDRPEHTEGYEGFFHLDAMQGNVETTSMKYIIRDHDKEKFAAKKVLMQDCVNFLNKKYGKRVQLELKDSYYNMKEIIQQHPQVMQYALDAMKKLSIKPVTLPVRGGTDGSQLSYMGLPTPNIFTGGLNCHGKYEMAVVSWMQKSVDLILQIVQDVAAAAE